MSEAVAAEAKLDAPAYTAENGIDVLTQVLAIVGAVTGVSGTAIAVFTFFRDRPRLVVTANGPYLEQGQDVIRVFAANHGRQGVAILDAGVWLKARRRPWLRRIARRFAVTKEAKRLAAIANLEEQIVVQQEAFSAFDRNQQPILLAPAEVHAFTVELPEDWKRGPSVGDVLVPYARDSRRKWIEGPPTAHLTVDGVTPLSY